MNDENKSLNGKNQGFVLASMLVKTRFAKRLALSFFKWTGITPGF